MPEFDTMSADAATMTAPDRRRPGRTEFAPALIAVLRNPAADGEMAYHPNPDLQFDLDAGMDSPVLASPTLQDDVESEFRLIAKIIAVIFAACLAAVIAGA